MPQKSPIIQASAETVQYSDPITTVSVTATDVDNYGEALKARAHYTYEDGSVIQDCL